MAFKKISNQVNFIEQEHEILNFWKTNDIFKKLVEMRKGGPSWSFLDGPITANNPMGIHHAWGRTYKDVWQRFKAMQGYDQRWQNGYDCQGLWVEVNVEKALGFKSKRDIEDYGISDFIIKCKQRVLKYAAQMTEQSMRLGMWMDWEDPEFLLELREKLGENPAQTLNFNGPEGPVTDSIEQLVGRLGLPEMGGSYFTFSNENNFMIWTFLKQVWERNWLYKSTDVMPWCPRCGTGISQHEILTDGYKQVTHKSVFVRFPLKGREKEALLVWTTTPWTLTSNVAAAVNPELLYVKIKYKGWLYYLAKNTLKSTISGDYTVEAEMLGKELLDLTYRGPYDELDIVNQFEIPDHHKVISWENVSDDEGTGIVHIAPGAGAEDFELSKKYKLPTLAPLTEDGIFLDGFGWLSGRLVQSVAEDIFNDLSQKDLLFKIQKYEHRYPICWRCQEELVFRLVDEWYINMGETYDKPREELTDEEKEKSLRYQIMDIAEQIKWVPEFGKDRELDWLRNMHDWMISKKRYWGLALPIWECSSCEHFEVVGDEKELKEKAIEGWEKFKGHTPHRPYLDAIKIKCPKCNDKMSRIPDVGNPWLDAGIVPYSTMQYRRNKDYFEKWFPADFITESFPGQFRNWFYSVLAMSTVLEKALPYRTVLGYALLYGEDGRPMHKSWGNAISFEEGAEKIGVDVMRWMFCNHKPETNLLFGYHTADETRRRFLISLWNIYSFFTTYATIDGWEPQKTWRPKDDQNLTVLDRWLISKLHYTLEDTTSKLEEFNANKATQALETFIDDLSNWYIRRSRRRFWKSETDKDKSAAYSTLYYTLVHLIKILAPFVPFVTESMYQNLVIAIDPNQPESIHHCDWPQEDQSLIDNDLMDSMAKVRHIASLGHSARNDAGIRVRQPILTAKIHGYQKEDVDKYIDLLKDELNIKNFEFVPSAEELVSFQLVPDAGYWGPALQQDFPKLKKTVATQDMKEIAQKLLNGETTTISIDDNQTVHLNTENTEVRLEAKPGLAVSSEYNITVAIDLDIPKDLILEGLSREIVRRVQNLRKDAGLEMDARIHTVYDADSELVEAKNKFNDYICGETLSLTFKEGEPNKDEMVTKETSIDGKKLILGIKQAKT